MMSDEASPSTHDNEALIRSAGEQPSSPDRGRRAASDDSEEPAFFVPPEHVLQILNMASPPYAYPRQMDPAKFNFEERLREAREFLYHIGQAGSGCEHPWADIWDILTSKICDLAEKISFTLRPWDTLSLTTRESLRRLFGGSARPYYEARYASFALVQAWLWHALDDNLFSDPDKWATPQWKAFGTLCASFRHRAGTVDSAITREECGGLRARVECEFHHWRMLTIRVMMNEWGRFGANAGQHSSDDRLADRLLGKLAEIIDEDEEPTTTNEDEVRDIARYAVVSDFKTLGIFSNLMIAWRLPNVVMKGHPFRKSPALRNYDKIFPKTGEGRPIDFVVSPGLFLSGQPNVRFYEGSWVYPIVVAIDGTLEDQGAKLRSRVAMSRQPINTENLDLGQ
jgi:hypothetical protein